MGLLAAFFIQFPSCSRDQDFMSLIPGKETQETLMPKGRGNQLPKEGIDS